MAKNEMHTITMKQFFNQTASQFQILACRAGSEDCSDKWEKSLFQEGQCLHYEPRKGISLNIVIIYNVSDWMAGWTHFLDGLTMFYSDKYGRQKYF